MTPARLPGLRPALLALHRALLEHERRQYEKAFGRIPGNGAFLELVLNNPWFAWLRPLSGLLARMDEAEEEEGFVGEVRDFVTQRRYEAVLQESADVAVAHGKVISALPASVEA